MKEFCAAADVACRLTTATGLLAFRAIGVIGIQTLFDGASRQTKHLPPHCRFQRLQVQGIDALPSKQGLNIEQDFSGQQVLECGFF